MSELHNLFGERGAGKSAFFMSQAANLYFERGQEIWENSKRIIEEENKTRKKKLTPPDRVPIYTVNFTFEIRNPDGTIYKPYELKGNEIGIGKKYKKLYPGSVVFIDEAQIPLNSKKDLPRAVSAFFEESRHADLEIWIASQRPILINKDIRDLSHHFIQIYNFEMTEAPFGIICSLKWNCREFNNRAEVDEYVDMSNESQEACTYYRDTVYEDTGDILDYYDTKGLLKDYLPEEGSDYAS